MNDFTEEETVDKALEVFKDCMEKNMDDESTKLAMIQAGGATFKNVTRLFNQYMIDEGYAMTKEDKETIVDDVMSDADVSTEEGFQAAVDAIVERGVNISDKSAAALVRKYAKDNEIEVYKAAKAGSGTGRVGFAAKYYELLIANPAISEEEAAEFINNSEYSTDNVRNHMSHYQSIRKMANNIAAKLG
jgi:hypothetical protein